MKPGNALKPTTERSSRAVMACCVSVFFCLAAVLFFVSCSPALPRHPGPKTATYKATVDLRIHGFRRNYRVHLPPGYADDRPLPMVVVVHGAFYTAKKMEQTSGFNALADQKGFIAVYPNGMGIFGFLQHWNAGHCCGKAAADELDDVGYLATVIEDACTRLAVDRRRIYMVGFSNGGMLVHRFAAERGDLLAAVAPLAATGGGRPDIDATQWHIPDPVNRMPLLTIHGMSDQHVPFAGGKAAQGEAERRYWPVQKTLDVWIQSNSCRTGPIIRQERQGRVTVTTWSNCPEDAEVVLYQLQGWGHVWPGAYFTNDLATDNPLKGFDAARIIWDFFQSKKR